MNFDCSLPYEELSANSSWSQVITKLAALEQSYDRVYLVIEQEREKSKRSRLVSDLVYLFSHS